MGLAASAAIEGLIKIKIGHLIDLLLQYIISGLNKGCCGWFEHVGWEIVKMRGVVAERAYSYAGCRCLKIFRNFDKKINYYFSRQLVRLN